ncbi:hypothetical protein BBP00_00007773 [Phytophthora kernoviae]|uniref:Fe2OG dioxygenase domain-containing protein n=3 Tax=Phytophthora kernoviae TaxID=325452 RepID=A0A3F2RH77_9STRA|nr:hypothetical protein BBP00_00007773 [Phytophthora kernoviae]
MDVRQVPVVDIGVLMSFSTDAQVNAALLNTQDEALRRTIDDVRAAATEWGFFYIANHGLPEQEVTQFQSTIQSFFHLPKEVKNTSKYERLVQDKNQWVDEKALPGFREETRKYFSKMEYISRRLLKVFAVALGEAPAFFDQFFYGDNSSFLRLNYYPVTSEPEKTMGVYQHTDAGALTVLLQDDEVASLQAFHRESQTWNLVSPRKGTYTINIGDMVQVWSNDQFVAPLHRVLASSGAERFSAPFFYNPSYKALVEPIVVKDGDVATYRPLSWRNFRLQRFQGDYADVGKENQISDFKIGGSDVVEPAN